MSAKIDWTKIKHDVNGNPRYVCSFLNLLTEKEQTAPIWNSEGRRITPTKYEIAVKRANKLGGRKFHNKSYGGGIVFQSYNLDDTGRYILQAVERAEKEQAAHE